MAKLIDFWVPGPVPGRAYAEIEGGMLKYGFAPAGIELDLLEYPLTTIHEDQEFWLFGGKKAGARFVVRHEETDPPDILILKLQVFVAGHKKTLEQKRFSR